MILKLKFTLFAVLVTVGLSAATQVSDERVNTEFNWKIRHEATTNSQIMNTLHYLTDVYGPRLTGCRIMKRLRVGQWNRWKPGV